MEFYPKNKYLLVEPVEEKKAEEKSSAFLLPENYKKTETHKLMRLLKAGGGSEYSTLGLRNKLILVPSQMVEEVKVMDKVMYLVPENAVCGVFLD
jgi:hypothetical protein